MVAKGMIVGTSDEEFPMPLTVAGHSATLNHR